MAALPVSKRAALLASPFLILLAILLLDGTSIGMDWRAVPEVSEEEENEAPAEVIAAAPSPSSLPGLVLAPDGTSALTTGTWFFSEKDVQAPGCVREFRLQERAAGSGGVALRRIVGIPGSDVIGKCLMRKDVMFLGDSTLLAVMLALIIQLDSGIPADPLNPEGQNRPVNHKRSDFWECDAGFACDYSGALNVYYRSRPYAVNVTFLEWRDNGFTGHFPMGHNKLIKYTDEHPGFASEPGWQHATSSEMADLITRNLPPQDFLFVNAGLFRLPEFETVESAIEQLRVLEGVMKTGRKPIWFSSTLDATNGDWRTSMRNLTEMEAGTSAALQLGWRVFDRRAMDKLLLAQLTDAGVAPVPNAYVSDWDLQPYVLTEMANVLMNMVCE